MVLEIVVGLEQAPSAMTWLVMVTKRHCDRRRGRHSLGSVGVLNTLNLDQRGTRVGGVPRALVAQVASPVEQSSQYVIFILVG